MGLRNSLPASPGGVSDHGALTGLGDDDHSQYLNTTRHSAITGNPHGTVSADISDLAETIRDTIGTALVAGSNITLTVNDPGDTITIAATSTPATNERVKTNRYVVADSPATWSKESWCKIVRVQMWAPGGSGGGGSRRAAGATSRGGGGGSSGCVVDILVPAEQCGSTETVTVGSVGSVGAGATVNNTAGGVAGSSSDCTFGSIAHAKCGLPGGPDSVGSGVTNGGLIDTTLLTSVAGGGGYDGASTQTLGTTTTRMTTSGGGGGGLSTANARVAGAAGGLMNANLNTVFNTPTAAAGGSAVGANGGNGSVFAGMGFGGGGGAAGDTAGTVAGGNGGAGGFPGGGGGGGGGSRNGANGGNGGLGGAGLVIITQYG